MKLSREQYRYFLKDSIRLTIDFNTTDQSRGAAPPPLEKPVPAGSKRIELVPPAQWEQIPAIDLLSAIKNRKSHRQYSPESVTLEELSFLLWVTQGIREKVGEATAFRTVPSAGCRHALETYLCVLNIAGLEQGIYRYLPVEHQLVLVSQPKSLTAELTTAALNQAFVGKAAVTFLWTTIPYRMEWRYGLAAHKVIAIDAGHVCQNLYLACAAINAGTCAIGAYHQERMDALLGVDGEDEFVIYLAPVGKI
jgi:SagB-type dehydrogenase family enzyme